MLTMHPSWVVGNGAYPQPLKMSWFTSLLKLLGMRYMYSGEDGKAVIWRVSESEPSVVGVPTRLSLCIHYFSLYQTLLCLTLFWSSVPICFHFCSLVRSRLDCSCSILAFARASLLFCRLLVGPVPHGTCCILALAQFCFTCWLPLGWISTMGLVVWGRDNRDHSHNGYIYTHTQTYKCELTTLHD